MSFGLHDYDSRRRRRSWIRVVKTLVVIASLVMLALFGYQTGVMQIEHHDATMAADNQRLLAEVARQKAAISDAAARQADAETKAAALQARLDKEVPVGELGRLNRLVADRLAAGVLPDRLAYVIQATQNPHDCRKTATKRFILPVTGKGGARPSISMADDGITITGEGTPAKTKSGAPLAWFDPQATVSLHFSRADTPDIEASGVLPLHQSIVMGTAEFRYTAEAGSRSLIEITEERCPFP